MKIKNSYIALLSLVVLMSSGCGNPSATTPPSANVSINKYVVTGTAPGAIITASPNNPFTNNVSVPSFVAASKATLITIPKTSGVVSSPTYSESITMSASASYNAMITGPTQVLNGKGSPNALTAMANNPFAGEEMLRQSEASLIKQGAGFQSAAKINAQGLNALGNGNPDIAGTVNTFWVNAAFNSQLSGDVQVTATCVYADTTVYIYVDNLTPASATTYTAPNLNAIAASFAAIYATDRATFGSEWKPGIDNDNRVTILISPAVNNYGANGVLGYFWGKDEYTRTTATGSVTDHSNQREMFYVVDTPQGSTVLWADAGTPAPINAKKGYAILAHEFQHMINFYQKGIQNKSEDTWLNEGLSMYAMQACGYGLPQGDPTTANQVKLYLNWPETTSLLNWGTSVQGVSCHYAMSYLFVLYLVEQYGGGVGTTQSQAMLNTMESNASVGIANVETQTGAGTFGNVFKNWATANLLDKITTNPVYNYVSIDMHGTYGGVVLPGIVPFTYNTYPRNANVPALGWSARYEQFSGGTNNALNISIQNNSASNNLDGIVVVQ